MKNKKRTPTTQTDLFPAEVTDQSRRFYINRALNGDVRGSLAMELTEGADRLDSARNQISIGHFTVAREKLLNHAPEPPAFELSEQDLESARLAVYEGQFESAIEFATRCFKNSTWNVTRLTALQVRATAFFELRRFRESLVDIENAEALSILAPHTASITGLKGIRLRHEIRKKSFEAVKDQLLRWIDVLWVTNGLNLDRLHQIERVNLDLLRYHGRDYSTSALKTFHFSESLGEKFFSALGRFDLWTSLNSNLRSRSENVLTANEPDYLRIQSCKEDILSKQPLTEVGVNVARSWAKEPEFCFTNDPSSLIEEKPDFVLDESFDLIVNLASRDVINLKNRQQLKAALIILKDSPCEKEKFFKSVWEGLHFSAEKHDGVIRTLLSRIRKDLGVDIRSNMGEIALRHKIFCG